MLTNDTGNFKQNTLPDITNTSLDLVTETSAI